MAEHGTETVLIERSAPGGYRAMLFFSVSPRKDNIPRGNSMLRARLRLVAVNGLVLLLAGARPAAAETEQKHSFRFTIVSDLDMDVAGQKQKIDAETAVQYTWTR